MTPPMIRADALLLVLRGELGEWTAQRNALHELGHGHDREDGGIEVLEWAIEQVEARARKVAA